MSSLNLPAALFESASVNQIAPILWKHAVHQDQFIGHSEEAIYGIDVYDLKVKAVGETCTQR